MRIELHDYIFFCRYTQFLLYLRKVAVLGQSVGFCAFVALAENIAHVSFFAGSGNSAVAVYNYVFAPGGVFAHEGNQRQKYACGIASRTGY